MPKKLKPAQTKLSKQIATERIKTRIGILDSENKKQHFPRAFRFTTEDLQSLKKITKFVNQERDRKSTRLNSSHT